MKALLLAAGRGTRLRPLTHDVPKPMLPILGKPVMEWLIVHLAAHGFREIMVNTSYLAPRIESYFGDGSRWGVQIGYSFEGRLEHGELVDEPVGSAGALRRIQDHSGFFDRTALVVCADALVSLDLRALLRFHRRRRALATMALTRVPRARLSDYGVVSAAPDGRIRGFQEKPGPDRALTDVVNTGIYLFEPGVIDRIPSSAPYDIGGQLFPALVEEGAPFFGLARPFDWRDVGSVSDYHATCLAALRGDVPGVRPGGRRLGGDVHVGLNVRASWPACQHTGPLMIGASATLEPGCSVLGPAVIGRGAVIEAGARVERSIVGDYTRVGRGTVLVDAIAAPGYCVHRSGRTMSRSGLTDARATSSMTATRTTGDEVAA